MMKDYFNKEYRRARVKCNESFNDMKIHYSNDMLIHIKHLMMSFRSIINVNEFIAI